MPSGQVAGAAARGRHAPALIIAVAATTRTASAFCTAYAPSEGSRFSFSPRVCLTQDFLDQEHARGNFGKERVMMGAGVRNLVFQGEQMPLVLEAGWGWESGHTVSAVADILLREILGVNTEFVCTWGSIHAMKLLGGCANPMDSSEPCTVNGTPAVEPPLAHVSAESWVTTPEEVAEMNTYNTNIGMLGYYSKSGLFFAKGIAEKAFRDEHISLEWWESFARYSGTHQYFDSWSGIAADLRAFFPDDDVRPGCTPGSSAYEDMQAHGYNCTDGWFFAPSCVAEKESCIPVILAEYDWNARVWVQAATEYGYRFAITWIGARYSFPYGVRSGRRVLFYCATTSAMCHERPLVKMFADTHMPVGRPDLITSLLKVVWRKLEQIDARVYEFLTRMSVDTHDLEAMMIEYSKQLTQQPRPAEDDFVPDIACRWVRNQLVARNALGESTGDNSAKWIRWIPRTCHPGEHYDRAAGECVLCAGGEQSPDGRECRPCAHGTRAPAAGTAHCEPCDVGRWQNGTDTTECFACPPGTRRAAAQKGCELCGPGQYVAEPGQSECLLCPLGEWRGAADGDAARCRRCPAGRTTRVPGARGEADCICGDGTYQSEGACVACPVGTTTDAGALGMEECRRVPGGGDGDDEGGLIGGVVACCVTLVAFAAAAYIARRLRRNDTIAEQSADKIENMELDDLDWLLSVPDPDRTQKAFIRILQILKEYRPYMPDSLLSVSKSRDSEGDFDSIADKEVVQKPARAKATPPREKASAPPAREIGAGPHAVGSDAGSDLGDDGGSGRSSSIASDGAEQHASLGLKRRSRPPRRLGLRWQAKGIAAFRTIHFPATGGRALSRNRISVRQLSELSTAVLSRIFSVIEREGGVLKGFDVETSLAGFPSALAAARAAVAAGGAVPGYVGWTVAAAVAFGRSLTGAVGTAARRAFVVNGEEVDAAERATRRCNPSVPVRVSLTVARVVMGEEMFTETAESTDWHRIPPPDAIELRHRTDVDHMDADARRPGTGGGAALTGDGVFGMEVAVLKCNPLASAGAPGQQAFKGLNNALPVLESPQLTDPSPSENENVSIDTWLESKGLNQYTHLFKKAGYDDVYVLKAMPPAEVDKLVAVLDMLPGHAAKLRHLLAARAPQPTGALNLSAPAAARPAAETKLRFTVRKQRSGSDSDRSAEEVPGDRPLQEAAIDEVAVTPKDYGDTVCGPDWSGPH